MKVLPTPESVRERLDVILAEAGGVTHYSAAMNRLSPPQRAMMPVLLASGGYEVTRGDTGGLTIRRAS